MMVHLTQRRSNCKEERAADQQIELNNGIGDFLDELAERGVYRGNSHDEEGMERVRCMVGQARIARRQAKLLNIQIAQLQSETR
jgi:hypothetical protein